MLLVTDKDKYRYLVDNNNSGIVPTILSMETYNERKNDLTILYDFETIHTICYYDEYTDSINFIGNCKDETLANDIVKMINESENTNKYSVIKNKIINRKLI